MMRQLGPNTWVFEPPDQAAMKAHCRTCNQSVAILKPQSVTFSSGNYVVRGECGICGNESFSYSAEGRPDLNRPGFLGDSAVWIHAASAASRLR